jgi:protease I
MKILMLVEQMYEDLELWYPKIRLTEAGYTVVTAGPEIKPYVGKYGLKCEPDITIAQVKNDDYGGILIPGGFAPDWLRRYPEVLSMVKDFNNKGKLVGFICHAG